MYLEKYGRLSEKGFSAILLLSYWLSVRAISYPKKQKFAYCSYLPHRIRAANPISFLPVMVGFSGVREFNPFLGHLDVGNNPLHTLATSNLKIFLNPLWDRTFVL
jgi:hypothetical protein